MKCPVLPVELKYIQILTENNLDFLKNVNFIQPFGQLQLTYISEELYYIEKKIIEILCVVSKSFYSCGFYKFPNNWYTPPHVNIVGEGAEGLYFWNGGRDWFFSQLRPANKMVVRLEKSLILTSTGRWLIIF